MKRKSKIKLEYLTESLKYELSEDEVEGEDSNKWTLYSIKDGQLHKLQSYKLVLAYVFIFIITIPQLPILIIVNFLIIIRALKYGIPAQIVPPFIGPAKTVDLVDNKIKIEVRHREHPPPHFHVIIDNEDCSFDILTCEHLNGNFKNKKYYKRIKKWYNENRDLLIHFWNETRPTDCPVGLIT
jgi:hypothetical protein